MINHSNDGQLNIDNLLGSWRNVSERSDFIANLSIEGNARKLELIVGNCEQQFASVNYQGCRLRIVPLSTSDSTVAAGFSFLKSDSDLIIAANEKNGVLVLQCYRRNADGKGLNVLTREFYARVVENGMTEFTTDIAQNLAENGNALQQFSGLLGKWRNTKQNSQWVEQFDISMANNGFSVLAQTELKDVQWPRCQLTPYVLDQNEMGFIAFCQSTQISSLFSAYSNKGLIVVSSFHQFNNSDAPPVFNREFYSKQLE